MTGDKVVSRARSATRQGAHYGLGSGGFKPDAPTPWEVTDPAKRCDCSGFASWALGVSRFVKSGNPLFGALEGAWLETTAIYADATADSPGAFFSIPWESAAPGDLIVYPDHKDAAGIKREGHIAVVGHVGESGPNSIIHCSLGNANSLGDAIAETSVLPFWHERKAVVARCSLVHPNVPPVV